MKPFDYELKKKVRSLDLEIPVNLEEAILEELNRMEIAPGHPRPRENRIFIYGALAAAAVLLLVAILSFFPFVPSHTDTVEAGDVFVQSAQVESEPASMVVIKETDPDMTIVWIEKINK